MATKLTLWTHNATQLATIWTSFNKFGHKQEMTTPSDCCLVHGGKHTFNCESHLTSKLLKHETECVS